MSKSIDEQARRKYNRMLLKDGFVSEFKNNIKKLYQTEDKDLTFPKFLLKHMMVFVCGMVPLFIDFVKGKSIELDTIICTIFAVLLLSFACWRVSKIKI